MTQAFRKFARSKLACVIFVTLFFIGEPNSAPQAAAADAAQIIDELADKDAKVRAAAATRAVRLKDPSLLNVLVRALTDSDNTVRLNAARAIAGIPDDKATQASVQHLTHADPAVRRSLFYRFYVQRTVSADLFPVLRRGLADQDKTARQYAAGALSKIPDAKGAVLAEIIKAVKHPDPIVRRPAVLYLNKSPDARVPGLLIAALDDSDKTVRAYAAAGLRRINDPRARAALKTFDAREKDKSGLKSLYTNARMSRLKNASSPAAMTKLLQHRNSTVRSRAATALKAIPGEAATQAALAAFEHPDPAVRAQVVARFLNLKDASAVPALAKAIDDMDTQVRAYAAQALRGAPGTQAAKASLNTLNHADPAVRAQAAYRLLAIPDAAAVPALKKALGDMDSRVRTYAAQALRKTPGEAATQAALAAFSHPDPAVRAQVVHRFIDLPDTRASERLVKLLDDPFDSIRVQVLTALINSGDAKAIAALLPLLDHEDGKVRRSAGSAAKAIAQRTNSGSSTNRRSLFERKLRTLPLPLIPMPQAYVEILGGDRIAGEVVGHVSETGSPPHLLIKPSSLAVVSVEEPNSLPSREARVLDRWIRRVVWQRRRGITHYRPGSVFLLDGRRIGFRTLRWSESEIVLLTDNGARSFAFRDIAELHLPQANPWKAYYEQLAMAGVEPSQPLLRLVCADGSCVTVPTSRFLTFFNTAPDDPRQWGHAFQPAWSLDVLSGTNRHTWLRSSTSPTDVPLFPPAAYQPESDGLRWQADRSVHGGALRGVPRRARWGFGVQADNLLQFQIPRAAVGFVTQLGLDRSAGRGGCARGIVRLRRADRLTQIYKSPLLIGSDKNHDTGSLKLPPFEPETLLELVADSAHADRPRGADPLNIRDMLNWSEPRLLLDAGRLRAAALKQTPGLIADQTGWQLKHPGESSVGFAIPWWTDGGGRSQSVLVVKQAPATLTQTIPVGHEAKQLLLPIWRTEDQSATGRVEVSINGELVGVFDVPTRTSPQTPLPIAVPLGVPGDLKFDVAVRIDESTVGKVYVGSVAFNYTLPSLFALFEDYGTFSPIAENETAKASLVEDGAYSGRRALKLTPGGRFQMPLFGTVKIREQPGEDAFRFLRFAFRKTGRGRVSLELRHPDAGQKPLRYDAGRGTPSYGPTHKIWPAGVPDEWVVVEVDLFEDWGETELDGLVFGTPDGEYALIDCIYLARNRRDFAKIPGVPSITDTNRQARRALAKPVIDKTHATIVAIEVEGRRGSGVLVGEKGYVLTAGDILADSGLVATLRFSDGTQVKGRTAAIDRDANCGIIKLAEKPKRPGLKLSGKNDLPKDELYVGFSFSPQWYGAKQAASYVTAIVASDEKAFQPDFMLSGAWPGGPLFDENGHVVGIHTGSDADGQVNFSRVIQLNLEFPK